jgi:hypothetical protein
LQFAPVPDLGVGWAVWSSSRKDWNSIFVFAVCLFSSEFHHRWTVSGFGLLVLYFQVWVGAPSFGAGSCSRRRLVGRWSYCSSGWCLFWLLVVCSTGCSSMVSGLFFSFFFVLFLFKDWVVEEFWPLFWCGLVLKTRKGMVLLTRKGLVTNVLN